MTIYYNFINNQTELEVTYKGTSAASYAGKVVVPESVTYEGKSYPVTSIGNNALFGCSSLTELTIGNSVTSIGERAFSGCSSLTELTIPNSVTSIGKSAFFACSGLTEVTIGNSVTTIGLRVFEYCSGLKKITVENGNPNYDSREDCNAIIKTNSNELIAGCKNTIIPDGVTSIGNYAFFQCSGLTELTIPNSVTYIGENAFGWCSGLTEVTIGDGVTSIGYQAFFACIGLTELTIPNSVTSIGAEVFSSCIGLKKIAVENGNPNYDSREDCNAIIKTNSNELIAGCKNTIIPDGVTSIGNDALFGCSGLTELTIPNSVTSIGNYAFYNCSGLTELTIPNSVTSIGESAFMYCSGLTTIYSLNTTPPTARGYNGSAFNDSHYTTVDVFVPEEALEAYQTADVWKDFQKLHAIDATAITEVNAAEQIQTANGQIVVTGLTDGTTVAVYDLGGQQVGQTVSKGGQAAVSTGLTSGSVVVKVGERSVKVTMK